MSDLDSNRNDHAQESGSTMNTGMWDAKVASVLVRLKHLSEQKLRNLEQEPLARIVSTSTLDSTADEAYDIFRSFLPLHYI